VKPAPAFPATVESALPLPAIPELLPAVLLLAPAAVVAFLTSEPPFPAVALALPPVALAPPISSAWISPLPPTLPAVPPLQPNAKSKPIADPVRK